MAGPIPKQIEYYINEKGCHICTSHCKDKDGYCYARINKKTGKLHRKLWIENYGPIPDGMVIRHTCDNPSCINLAHLLIGTPSDNTNDMLERGRQAKGEFQGCAVLSEYQVVCIIADTSSTIAELARKFNVAENTIQQIKRGGTWKHIERPNGIEGPRETPKGENHSISKLTEQDVVKIIADGNSTHQSLADKYNVSVGCITAIKNNRTWKHISRDNLKKKNNIGENNTNSKLTTNDVIYILSDKSSSLRKLAARLGVAQSTIKCIKHGKKWKHISSMMNLTQ